jgi:hypothetical protein
MFLIFEKEGDTIEFNTVLIFKIRFLLKKVRGIALQGEDEKCLTDWHYRIN